MRPPPDLQEDRDPPASRRDMALMVALFIALPIAVACLIASRL